MVRLSIAPGPLEGSDVYDAKDRHVGVVEDIHVTGMHITSFRVAVDPDIVKRKHLASPRIDVARDWIINADGNRFDLGMGLEELLRRTRPDR